MGRADSTGALAGGKAPIAAAVVGALLSLGYAAWAFTTRRGIFQDFADGSLVTADDAKSSDTIDTIFLLVAGLVAVIALLLLARELIRRTLGRWSLKLIGLSVGVLGAIAVVLGLALANDVADSGSQTEQGERGVTATVIVGGGFLVVAVGLLVGSFGIRGNDNRSR